MLRLPHQLGRRHTKFGFRFNLISLLYFSENIELPYANQSDNLQGIPLFFCTNPVQPVELHLIKKINF